MFLSNGNKVTDQYIMGKLLTQRIWTFQQGVWVVPRDISVGKMEKFGRDSSSTRQFVADGPNAWAKGLMDWCPTGEKVLVGRVKCSAAVGCILLLFNVFIGLNKNVDDMFIPFSGDPDLGSTVTSFHARLRIKIDLRDRPRLARVSQGALAKVLHQCLDKPITLIAGSPGPHLCFNRDLCVNFVGSHLSLRSVCINPVM